MKVEDRLSRLIKAVEQALKHIDHENKQSDDFIPSIRDILEEGLSSAIKATKEKGGYRLVYSTDQVPTCQVLRQELTNYYKEFPDKYPIPMYTEFIRYWSEPNPRGVPRWYSEKNKPRGRFYIPGRLATWAKGYKAPKETAEPKQPTHLPDRLKMRVV